MKISLNFNIFLFCFIFYFTNQLPIYSLFIILILIHELAHILVGLLFKAKPKELKITPFGVSVSFEKYKSKNKRRLYKQQILIYLAGPLINILLAFIAFIAPFAEFPLLSISTTEFIYANIVLAIFNLLPIYPLDGGRIFKNILSLYNIDYKSKIVITQNLSLWFLIFLTFCSGMLILILENIALFFIFIYLWYLMFLELKRNKIKLRYIEILDNMKKYNF